MMAESILSILIELMFHWKSLENTCVALVQKITSVTLFLEPEDTGQGGA